MIRALASLQNFCERGRADGRTQRELVPSNLLLRGCALSRSGAWGEFLHAAKHLADTESEAGAPYPSPGVPCLLCQQALSDDAARLLHRLWEFLKGEAKRLLAESESHIAQRHSSINSLRCEAITPQSALEPVLREWSAESLPLLNHFLAAAETRRATATLAITAAADAPMSLNPLPAPYLVVMTYDVNGAKSLADAAGLDAISAYAFQRGDDRAPYSKLTSDLEAFWEIQRSTKAAVVPLAMAGWDRRPRVENPVPWEHFGGTMEKYYETATPEQVAAHVRTAVKWVQDHAASCPAQAVVIYAWNEFDEGGWLCPTLTEGDARAQALGRTRN